MPGPAAVAAGNYVTSTRERVRENDSGNPERSARTRVKHAGRVPCGARRRRDGQPCEALSVPGKRRCKWHGGCSTGPRTAEGKAKVAANLPGRK